MYRRRRAAAAHLLPAFVFAVSILSTTAFHDTTASAAPHPHLAIATATPDTLSIEVKGSITDTKRPTTFRLRQADGCARDATISSISVNEKFTLSVNEADLADAYACVIDADMGETPDKDGSRRDTVPLGGASIGVTPSANVLTASHALSLDTFSVASLDLEPHGGQTVRVAIISDVPIARASLSLLETTVTATSAPAEDWNIADSADASTGVHYTRITFEVPSRLWARATILSAPVSFSVIDTSSTHHAIEARVTSTIELIDEEE